MNNNTVAKTGGTGERGETKILARATGTLCTRGHLNEERFRTSARRFLVDLIISKEKGVEVERKTYAVTIDEHGAFHEILPGAISIDLDRHLTRAILPSKVDEPIMKKLC